jgi:hypothetical protein
MIRYLLPEEDALEADDDADPTLPGDLWFRRQSRAALKKGVHRRA